MSEIENDMRETLITLTSDIVAAHVSNNSVSVGDLPTLISNVYSALAGLSPSEPVAETAPEPAVSIALRSRTITSSASKTARSSRCSSVTLPPATT
jgi:predicted transcriptional regulator